MNQESEKLRMLIGAMTGEPLNDLIEDQEARGQESFCGNETLPCKGLSTCREVLEGYGIIFDDKPLEDDPIFIGCTFPDGWKKEATDHSLHSELVDDKGRCRSGIFYKAAFYDRSAHIYLNKRFNIRRDWTDDCDGMIIHRVFDGKEEAFKGDNFVYPSEYDDYSSMRELPAEEHRIIIDAHSDAEDRSMGQCKAWLHANYPDWDSFTAYWEE